MLIHPRQANIQKPVSGYVCIEDMENKEVRLKDTFFIMERNR